MTTRPPFAQRWFLGALVACTLGTARADTPDPAFDAKVRAYLLANPEIILEALEILSQREQQAATRAKIAAYPDLFTDPPALGLGAPDAPLRVVEFFDYRCVPCKTLHAPLRAALADHPEIRVEMRHLPILSPGSERAARFALAVNRLGGAAPHAQVHEAIWALTGPLNMAALQGVARDHGLDWQAIQTEMQSEAVTARINRNRDIAIDLGILGTPAFVTPNSVSFGQTDAGALIAGWLAP